MTNCNCSIRAAEVLSKSETFVSVGYSLPLGDAHVRQLMNIGLSTGKLRQAVVLVGSDADSRQRWTSLFRESWRQARLSLPSSYFQNAVPNIIMRALNVPDDLGNPVNKSIMPLSMGFKETDRAIQVALLPILKSGLNPPTTPDQLLRDTSYFSSLKVHMRQARQGDPVVGLHGELSRALDWRPSGPILPSHGNNIFTS
jgi:hypothetical protein